MAKRYGTILVVEDEATLRQVITRNLEARGHAVRGAETATEALRHLSDRTPDLMLLDINLPDRSGWDVLRELREHHIEAAWPAGERVMACVDVRPDAQRVLRRGWRMANRLQADLLAVFVETPGWANASPEERRALEENLRFAEDLGAEIIRVTGSDVAKELVRVAREKNAGRIVIGHPRRRGLSLLLRGSTAVKLLRLATDVDVQVVAAAMDL